MESGAYDEAIAAFEALKDFKDSAEKIEECQDLIYADMLASYKNTEVGGTVMFGHYEQDGNTSNGSEEIEWIVLAREEGRILVISKYGLDGKAYDNRYAAQSWEKSLLREWLNTEFLAAAFDEDEQSYIPEVAVTAEDNPLFETDGGKDTKDRVFLLSANEVSEKYFASDAERQCKVTEYARSQGAANDGEVGRWWLRTPGKFSKYAVWVWENGNVNCAGSSLITKNAVRPALWIEYER